MRTNKTKVKSLLKLSIPLVLLCFTLSCATTNTEYEAPVAWLNIMSDKSGLMISNERLNYDYNFYVNPTDEERRAFKKMLADGKCKETPCVVEPALFDSEGKKRDFDGHLSKEWVAKLRPIFTPDNVNYYLEHVDKSKFCEENDNAISVVMENIREAGGTAVAYWCKPDEVTDQKVKKMLNVLKELEEEMFKKHPIK